MNIKLKKLSPFAIIPTRATNAAGYDLYADIKGSEGAERIYIRPGKTVKIHTGIALEIPTGSAGFIFSRNDLAVNWEVQLANGVGCYGADYRDEYIVILHNGGDATVVIEHGNPVAQLVVMPVFNAIFEDVDELSDTSRGEGGFGSTRK